MKLHPAHEAAPAPGNTSDPGNPFVSGPKA